MLSDKISVLVVSILLLALGCAFFFVYDYYPLSIGCLFGLMYVGYSLYHLSMRTANQFKVFTDSIKFSESNISFISNISDDAYVNYYNSLTLALDRINIQSQKREAEVSFYNNLLNRVDFALIVTNRENSVVWINKMALDILGRPKPANLDVIKEISDDFRKVFDSLQPKTPKTLKLDNQGKIRSLIVNLSTITIRGERLNIYSLKDVQSVVEETEDSAWHQLISILTHEIMNSLTPIISLSENLSNSKEDPKLLSKAMETIYRRSKGLVSFVNNYKKIAQIPPPQRTTVKVKSLIDDIVALMKGQDIDIHTLVTSDDLMLYADREQLEQVLINLVKNAKEACSEISYPMIKIAAMDNLHGQIILTVADNGAGMDSEILDKIFTPFYTTKVSGSGIGLGICRQIIAMHGGTLTAISTLEEGSVFTIRL